MPSCCAVESAAGGLAGVDGHEATALRRRLPRARCDETRGAALPRACGPSADAARTDAPPLERGLGADAAAGVEHLGIDIDLKDGLFRVPPRKLLELRQQARSIAATAAQESRLIPVRRLATVPAEMLA